MKHCWVWIPQRIVRIYEHQGPGCPLISPTDGWPRGWRSLMPCSLETSRNHSSEHNMGKQLAASQLKEIMSQR